MRAEHDAIGLSVDDMRIVAGILSHYADQIDEVSLYGSRAARTSRPGSDLDLLLSGTIDFHAMLNLGVAFEESDLSVAVDLKHERDLTDPQVRDEILKRSQLLFTRDDLSNVEQ
ncbi:nucleotidyltransferase domain-containing protein [Sphingopyxis solisilvae]|uniref:nucleotidyltransferase domain-containing protein n=1 Tax=Sphingopyxis solisilvae TaxID=1886788 RepID=UPI00189298B6|nr:nucleotidyltransferase domain-containing protein [Sphingopyxis solisilvae]